MQSERRQSPTAGSEHESLLPELLHHLSQPLTALRCSLELTLLQPRDSEEYRKRLRESLGLTEEIAILTAGIRELLEAENPGDTMQRLAFDAMLRTTVRELLPVADSQGVGLSLLCSPSLDVLGDPHQFSKALFYLLDFALSLSCKGDELHVQAHPDGATIEFMLELTKRRVGAPPVPASRARGTARSYLGLLIARRIFEVAGGTVSVERAPKQVCLRIGLPLTAPGGKGAPDSSSSHKTVPEILERIGEQTFPISKGSPLLGKNCLP